MSTVELPSGHAMPKVGYGTFKVQQDECAQLVRTALEYGVRHIDTAAVYGNEAGVGDAVRRFENETQERVFVVSKVSPRSMRSTVEKCLEGATKSLEKLALQRPLNLLLLHWPGRSGVPHNSPKNKASRLASWRALCKLKREGHVIDIGVSNFEPQHLEELYELAQEDDEVFIPAVNQVEMHPLFQQRELRLYCRQKHLCLVAYSPLACASDDLLKNPHVLEIARAVQRTPAQVVLRWALQHDVCVIPKSRTPSRIQENAQIEDFELSKEQMTQLDSLDCGSKMCWDPSTIL
ncbi:MAG: hypothetical protein MHM6MM_005104 [Cercozoa sp. M6MM]